MSTADKLRYKLETATVTEKLIAVNVLVFVFFFLARTIAFLFRLPSDFLMQWFVFPNEPGEFLLKPWSIITYGFLHAGVWHILSNMLILYFAGIYFLNYFSPKRLLNYYFLGIIIGGLFFMLSYNLFPAFAGTGSTYLIGASAGVMAILIGIASHIPNMRVRLLLLGSVKFWWIAVFLLVVDIVQIPISNAGGHIAHLGGALLGYVYTNQLQRGNDIGKWFENLMDWFVGLFKPRERKAKMKTVYRKKKSSSSSKSRTSSQGRSSKLDKDEKQKKVDAILDKISKSGYESLTKAEKDFLFQAGKED